MTTIADYIIEGDERRFSFEVLPPLKGTGTEGLFSTIDKLVPFNPAFINITTHHSEYIYRELPDGQFERTGLHGNDAASPCHAGAAGKHSGGVLCEKGRHPVLYCRPLSHYGTKDCRL